MLRPCTKHIFCGCVYQSKSMATKEKLRSGLNMALSYNCSGVCRNWFFWTIFKASLELLPKSCKRLLQMEHLRDLRILMISGNFQVSKEFLKDFWIFFSDFQVGFLCVRLLSLDWFLKTAFIHLSLYFEAILDYYLYFYLIFNSIHHDRLCSHILFLSTSIVLLWLSDLVSIS